MTRSRRCLCGSRKLYSNCCEEYLGTIQGLDSDPKETVLLEWLGRYEPPLSTEFMRKVRTYVFRISWLLESFLERYFDFPVIQKNSRLETKEAPVSWIEHNTLLCLIGALSCLRQGLFMQSGILLRSVLENCFVLVDISQNRDQLDKMLFGKYRTSNVIARVKEFLPNCIVEWYGYFSANFAHFGPLHSVPYLPRKCWPDNWVLVTGIQNIVRGCVAFGIVLERLHFDRLRQPIFWEFDSDNRGLRFKDQGAVWEWIERLGKELVTKYPPNERKEDFTYTGKTYRTK